MRVSQIFALALVFATLSLAGCGVRGSLEPPPNQPPADKDKPIVLDKLIR